MSISNPARLKLKEIASWRSHGLDAVPVRPLGSTANDGAAKQSWGSASMVSLVDR